MVHYIAFCITMQGHVYPGPEVIGFSGLEEDKCPLLFNANAHAYSFIK